jgi:protein-S-isoprenylcysteine O-methyltransferase Ste14
MNTSIPRLPPPFFFLVSIIAMILLHLYAPIGRWINYPWRSAGIVLIVAGLVLGAGSGMFFRKLGTNPRPGARATLVVKTGPFRFTRNPMYVGLTTILVGVAILLGTFSPLIVLPFFFIFVHTQFVLKEEKLMEEWFGESYLEYKRKTPRWFL